MKRKRENRKKEVINIVESFHELLTFFNKLEN